MVRIKFGDQERELEAIIGLGPKEMLLGHNFCVSMGLFIGYKNQKVLTYDSYMKNVNPGREKGNSVDRCFRVCGTTSIPLLRDRLGKVSTNHPLNADRFTEINPVYLKNAPLSKVNPGIASLSQGELCVLVHNPTMEPTLTEENQLIARSPSMENTEQVPDGQSNEAPPAIHKLLKSYKDVFAGAKAANGRVS